MFTLMTETRGLGEACRMFLLSEEMGLNTGHFERQIHAFVSNKFYSSLWPFFFLLWHLVCFSVLVISKVPILLG